MTRSGRSYSCCENGRTDPIDGSGRIEIRTVEQQKSVKCYGTGRYPPPENLDRPAAEASRLAAFPARHSFARLGAQAIARVGV